LNYSEGVLIVKVGCKELKDDVKLINILTNITIDVYPYQDLISMVCGNE